MEGSSESRTRFRATSNEARQVVRAFNRLQSGHEAKTPLTSCGAGRMEAAHDSGQTDSTPHWLGVCEEPNRRIIITKHEGG